MHTITQIAIDYMIPKIIHNLHQFNSNNHIFTMHSKKYKKKPPKSELKNHSVFHDKKYILLCYKLIEVDQT